MSRPTPIAVGDKRANSSSPRRPPSQAGGSSSSHPSAKRVKRPQGYSSEDEGRVFGAAGDKMFTDGVTPCSDEDEQAMDLLVRLWSPSSGHNSDTEHFPLSQLQANAGTSPSTTSPAPEDSLLSNMGAPELAPIATIAELARSIPPSRLQHLPVAHAWPLPPHLQPSARMPWPPQPAHGAIAQPRSTPRPSSQHGHHRRPPPHYSHNHAQPPSAAPHPTQPRASGTMPSLVTSLVVDDVGTAPAGAVAHAAPSAAAYRTYAAAPHAAARATYDSRIRQRSTARAVDARAAAQSAVHAPAAADAAWRPTPETASAKPHYDAPPDVHYAAAPAAQYYAAAPTAEEWAAAAMEATRAAAARASGPYDPPFYGSRKHRLLDWSSTRAPPRQHEPAAAAAGASAAAPPAAAQPAPSAPPVAAGALTLDTIGQPMLSVCREPSPPHTEVPPYATHAHPSPTDGSPPHVQSLIVEGEVLGMAPLLPAPMGGVEAEPLIPVAPAALAPAVASLAGGTHVVLPAGGGGGGGGVLPKLGGSVTFQMTLGGGSGRNLAERKEWTVEEDRQICRSVRRYGFKWRLVAADVPDRSDDAVRNRYNRVKLLPHLQPTAEELVAEQLEWEAVDGQTGRGKAARASKPKREASAPRERKPRVPPARTETEGSKEASSSLCSSDDDIKERAVERVSWSRAEDETIVRSVNELGNKWATIAERLPARTEHAIRNRYARLLSLASRGNPIVLSSGEGMPIGISLVPTVLG